MNNKKQADYIKNAYKIRITHMKGYERDDEVRYNPTSIICETLMINNSSMSIYDKEQKTTIMLSISGINSGIHCKVLILDANNTNVDSLEFDINFAHKHLYEYSHKYKAVEFRLLLEAEDIEGFCVDIEDPSVVGEPIYYFNYQPDINKQQYFSLYKEGILKGLRYEYGDLCKNYDIYTINEDIKYRLKENFVNVLNEVYYQEENRPVFGEYSVQISLKNKSYMRISYDMMCYDKYSWNDFVKDQVEFIEKYFKNLQI